MDRRFYDNEKVSELREKAKLSKQDLATMVNASLMHIYRVENGVSCSIELLASIAVILGAPLNSLIRPSRLELTSDAEIPQVVNI